MIEGVTLGEASAALVFIVGFITAMNYLISPIRKFKSELEDIKSRQDRNEKDMKDIHEYMYASLIAIKALLKHGMDGNDVESMKEASKNIDTYLNRKVKE